MKNSLKVLIFICIFLIVGIVYGFYIFFHNNNQTLENDSFQIGKASNMVLKDELNDVVKVLNDSNLDNVDIFKTWVEDFNKYECNNCGLLNKWDDYNLIKYDEISLVDNWEKYHNESDADCRMTAFLLIANQLEIKKTINKSGSYLMFDLDAIDNNDKYSILKENREKFITLFNEISIKKIPKEDIKNVYHNKWDEYGIELKNEKVSLISVIMHDNYFNEVFVGHAGLLIKLNNKLLFVEKIAFNQPYQVTVLKSKDELKELLFSRETYFGDKTEEGPFIYENGNLLFEYK